MGPEESQFSQDRARSKDKNDSLGRLRQSFHGCVGERTQIGTWTEEVSSVDRFRFEGGISHSHRDNARSSSDTETGENTSDDEDGESYRFDRKQSAPLQNFARETKKENLLVPPVCIPTPIANKTR